MQYLAATLIFGVCMAIMAVGVIFAGRRIRGSCGGIPAKISDEDIACPSCRTKEADLCPSDDDTGLLALSRVSHPKPHERHEQNLRKVIDLRPPRN